MRMCVHHSQTMMAAAYLTTAYRLCFLVVLLMLLYSICVHHYIYIFTLVTLQITYIYLERKYKQVLPINKKAVLITGCDTGFGHHLANRLADHGFIVFAGVLDINSEGPDKLKNRQLDNLHVVQLDLIKEDEIKTAVSKVKTILGSEDLWGIVNNAGFDIPGDLELCKLSQYKKCHDVNLYGQIAIIKAFLPSIRQSKGRIVNVSSVRGRYAWPGGSVYHMSKYGVETMSDSLRLEMVKFGVGVSVVEPGWFDGATSIISPANCERVQKECDEMWNDASADVKKSYSQKYFYLPYHDYVNERSNLSSASSPDLVLEAMEYALLNVIPKPRYIVGGSSGIYDSYAMLARFNNFMPTYMSDFILNLWTGCYRSVDEQCN